MSIKRLAKLWVWIPVLFILMLIFNFSKADGVQSNAFSVGLTDRLVNVFVAVPFLDINPGQEQISLNILYFLVRKLGHFTEYAALAFALAFAFYRYHVNKGKLISCSMSFGIFYACTDEIHQLFVPWRAGRFTDVLIDSMGMFFGILIFYSLINIYQRIRLGNCETK
jgi:VanZ family protein